ncbi:CBS domain-containing protein [Clostridium bovifaecis]|uniref:CBS domain-containing protein n=1 Tax=Clostridium bovifaecis TaxID=2184719 RepID=A0A6I6FCM0_9CLOT|nr:CBS domain-containing protein [Clostridium bovifaecis]
MLAKDIMKREVVSIKEDETLKDVVEMMIKHDISGLPVVNNSGKIVGIISERDILRHGKKIFMTESINLLEIMLYEQRPESYEEELSEALKLPVKKIMVKSIITADENEPVGEIALIMMEEGVNRVPILRNGELVGIIGREDIIRTIAALGKMKKD